MIVRAMNACRALPGRAALFSTLTCATLHTPVAAAHEYWLDPLDATPAPDQPILVSVLNGEEFEGNRYPFDPTRFTRVEMIGPTGAQPVAGRPGDLPALRIASQGVGLHTIVLEAGVRSLDYADMDAFSVFLDYHGLTDIAARHAARKLPVTDILERYSRHTKAYIDVQDAAKPRVAVEGDSPVLADQGMAYELVLEADPYTTGETVLQALFEGKPLADVQVELFVRDEAGNVGRKVERTDVAGRTRFDTAAAGDYLLNSAHVVEADPDDPAGAHWRSYWATITLERDSAAPGTE